MSASVCVSDVTKKVLRNDPIRQESTLSLLHWQTANPEEFKIDFKKQLLFVQIFIEHPDEASRQKHLYILYVSRLTCVFTSGLVVHKYNTRVSEKYRGNVKLSELGRQA